MLFQTSSTQIKVTIASVNRSRGFVAGWKTNKQRGGTSPFSVYFRDDEPVKFDGANVAHPKLVLAAASAAWRN